MTFFVLLHRAVMRSINRVFYVPSSIKSAAYREGGYPFAFRPFGKAQRESVARQIPIVSAVALLLFLSSPSAILWTIALGSVYAFYSGSFGTHSHIGVEVLKREPSFAYRYAVATVQAVRLMFSVGASLEHGVPRSIPKATLLQRCKTVRGCSVDMQASAASRVTVLEIAGLGERHGSTVALTPPRHAPTGSILAQVYGNEPTEADSGDIFCCVTVMPSHAVSSNIGDGVVSGWRPLPTGVSRASNYPTDNVEVGA